MLKEILRLAFPSVGEMILYMLIWVFDTLMIGKYAGEQGVSAVGLSSEIMYTFIGIVMTMGLGIGITSLISQSLGQNNYNKAKIYSTIGIKLGIVVAILISIIFYTCSNYFLKITGAKGEILRIGISYMKIVSVGTFFNMSNIILNAVYRGFKDMKTPLYVALIINIINILGDYILIFGKYGLPSLGVEGAGLATSIAYFVGFLFSLTRIKTLPFRVKLKEKIEIREMKEIIFLSVPSGLQEGAFSVVRLINISFIMSLGGISFAANQIAGTIESLSFMPGWGFAIACTTIVGYNFGAKKYLELKKTVELSLLLSIITMGTFALIFLIFPKQLVSLFIKTTEKEVIKLGSICLMIAAFEQIQMAVSMVVEGALKGMGDTKKPFFVSVFANWGIRIPFVYCSIFIFKLPVYYVWGIHAFQWTLSSIIIYIIYRNKIKKLNKNI